MNETLNVPDDFASTGLCNAVLDAVAQSGITIPTPIQAQAIPVALKCKDLIGVAQTGTGKTLAFSLPLLEKIQTYGGKGLILAPTRELALQIEEVIFNMSSKLKERISTIVLIGGMSMGRQVAELRRNPKIIIATPGRLQDHINERTINLSTVNTLILDEADRMLDMGFINQIKRIIASVPTNRQTMLFSATMSPEVTKLAAAYMREPVRIEVSKQGTAAEQVEQHLCYVRAERKPEVLNALLNRYEGSVLVFSRTKHGASKLNRSLALSGHQSTEIHSNKSLGQRRQALDGFKSGRYRVLVATDLAARGIDVDDIALVVNYDLPDAPADYVHRIGRTGRAGKSGLAISLAGHDQRQDVMIIERLVNTSMILSEFSEERVNVPQHSYSGSRSSGRPSDDHQAPWRRNNRPRQSGSPMGVGASRGSR